MSANQAVFPIALMARVLSVSKAGYYAWVGRPPSARAAADAALLKRIRTVHGSSRGTYGAPRVHAELRSAGERHSRKRIARLMREAGLVGASHRRGGPVTTRRDQEARPAPDLVDRDFTAAAPNQLWVADITFIRTAAGFLCLAVVLDALSRRIVGWSMANHLRTELVLDALPLCRSGTVAVVLATAHRCRQVRRISIAEVVAARHRRQRNLLRGVVTAIAGAIGRMHIHHHLSSMILAMLPN